MDIVVMDENVGKIDFTNPTSKLGSTVQINSIAIDISNSMEAVESPAHEHFSIRGFVAGMRKKDRKTCYPFACVGNDVDSNDNLPPLSVPEFQWWQSSSCVPDSEMKRPSERKVVMTKSANTSSCENVGGKKGFFRCKSENTCSKGKTYINGTEARNSSDMPEVNPQQVIERLDNTPDASDNALSCSDGTFRVQTHKRKPKLRSLADIMVGEKNRTSSINPSTRLASSCDMHVASTEMEAVLVPQFKVDVPIDVAKAGQSPEKKRKIALGEESEDKEPLAVICPRAASKRRKGFVLDGEEKSRRVELFDPKSKGHASMRLDLQRTQRIKFKKANAIDTSKTMRRTRRDDEIDIMRECLQPNAASSANLPIETDLGTSASARSGLLEIRHALVEMRPYFSSLSRQKVEKFDDLSVASMPADRDDDEPLMPLRKSISGKCNVRGKVASDQSLDSFMDNERNLNFQESFREQRCIPDLNMEIPGKTAMAEDQEFTFLSEKRSLPLRKELVENAREGNPQMQISEPKNKDNNNVELGESDDIPMEIVALLARNQYERELGTMNNNSSRGYSAVDANEHLRTINYPLASRTNHFVFKHGNMGVRPKIPTTSPQLKHCQLDTRRPKKNQFRPFSSRTPSQPRKPEFSTPTPIMAASRSVTRAESLCSSARENVPFILSVPDQPRHSFSDQSQKERTFSDMKDVAKFNEGRFGSIYPFTESSDPYLNDTIPAMQLLSLMDQRVKSGRSSEIGAKSSPDKPFSPCKHHPRLNGKENHSFLRGSLFPQNSNSKDSFWSQHVYSSSESSERAPSDSRVCLLNRNPADFSIPEVGNRYTRTAEDSKPRGPRAENVDGRKRQRMRKNALGKGMFEIMA